ncbi:MAG: hypothetical protein QN188_04285 [Armatimonadota bacterium]|nr:hypothetical protein [Armatimonadota bacterium]MDR5675602.1 hypothetical protein [Armatimonadota bacterium]MDR5689809.1 hypothetical protein [Armatimonadota bacterium]MDR7389322.1 hypothetical protein [Armatimonadota bacterium]MDR7391981.1 hypothetical protein [Armatimonadota bacterium]
MRRLSAVVGLGVFLTLASAALAQSYKAGEYQVGAPASEPKWRVQARTGATHAGFAAAAAAASSVDQHLGHALNCIEGSRGKNFNASWGHVCQGQGDGLLVDLRADRAGAAWLLVAEAADQLAVAGIRARDLAQKKNASRGVAELLRLIAESR